MKHKFFASPTDGSICRICKREEIDHGPTATCEVCGNIGPCNIVMYNRDKIILACEASCEEKEKANPSYIKESRESTEQTLKEILKKEDSQIKIHTDIFNSKIATINEIRARIESDNTIEPSNKKFALAQILDARFKHLSDVIFEVNQTKTDAENEQRAIQHYYNELSKTLRAEEKEKIRLKDVNYKPIIPEAIKKPKTIKIKKYDSKTIREAARNSGLNDILIQMTCVRHDITPEEAVEKLKAIKIN